MIGSDPPREALFSYVSPDARVPKDHPLRPIRKMVNVALEARSGEFKTMYSHTRRPSIAPEQLLRALLLQMLYSIRSDRHLVEQLDYNLLFRWFVGLSMDDTVWDHSTFPKNRERLIGSEIARAFLAEVIVQAREAQLLSQEHFSVDRTLLEEWASMKSFQPKDGDRPASGGGRNAHLMRNILSAVIGGVVVIVIGGLYSFIEDKVAKTDQVTKLNGEINASYSQLCLYFGTQDHYQTFDPFTFLKNHLSLVEQKLERVYGRIDVQKRSRLLDIVSHATNTLDNDIFLRADEEQGQVGKSLFSGIKYLDEIYFDNLRAVTWLRLPSEGCNDIRDFFLNSR